MQMQFSVFKPMLWLTGRQQDCKNVLFHGWGTQKEGISLPKQTKGASSNPLSASVTKLWMGIVFLSCQQLESRLPAFLLCVCTHCQERVTQGTMAAWSHKVNVWRQPTPSSALQGIGELSQVAKVLYTFSSDSLLAGSSFSSKSPQQDEDEGNFQMAPYLFSCDVMAHWVSHMAVLLPHWLPHRRFDIGGKGDWRRIAPQRRAPGATGGCPLVHAFFVISVL